MTREEIKNKIDELETARFYLEMKDRWSEKDYELDRKLCNEIKELKKQVA